ncbi:uncharacterized protein LOC128558311 [Mercenaria mercenaria]|uniref:uncharacterized protein LOC128558311 n=1 Tax=Mercenaria mercenaria TaxID=6596 RepID=UPI00234EA1A5|nr:uncharacterized protein LOC128558311 [Mercenaria mercenaria]
MQTVFQSYSDAEKFIETYEKENAQSYTKWHMRNHGIDKLSSMEGHRIWWEDRRGAVPIDFDGVPFVCVQSEVRQCHQGKDKRKRKEEIVGDHVYGSSRRRIQATKKMNCQASIRMKMVVRFPEYKIDGHASQWKKRIVSNKLREEFSASTQQDFRVYLKIQDNHEGHMVGEDNEITSGFQWYSHIHSPF